MLGWWEHSSQKGTLTPSLGFPSIGFIVGQDMKEDSGELSVRGNEIHYESTTHSSWVLHVESVRLIGEYTNQNGPFADDYFLVFVPKGSDDWYRASFYAEGRDESLKALSPFFPGLGELGLSGSANFASRVLWPPIDGDPALFDFLPIKRGDSLLDRFLDRVIPGSVFVTTLREEFEEKATQDSRPGPVHAAQDSVSPPQP